MIGETVLLIQDEERDTASYREALEQAGFCIVTFRKATDALQSALITPPDAVVTDDALNGMDGCQLLLALRQHAATVDVPVILLTGPKVRLGLGFSAEDTLAFYGEEAQAYLRKPVDTTTLIGTVRQVIGDCSPASMGGRRENLCLQRAG